jgi:peptidyl-tRNA hydrolase
LLVADDAIGGFFALNGGAWGADVGQAYYWAPDDLEWNPLGLGYSELLSAMLTSRINEFYSDLRWPKWESDVSNLPADSSFNFYPFLWTEEGSLANSLRSTVPTSEALDSKLDIVRRLSRSGAWKFIKVEAASWLGLTQASDRTSIARTMEDLKLKQVVVVNEALRLPRGKLAAQVAHAAVSSFLAADAYLQRVWLSQGMPKVVLRCDSPDELEELERKAIAAGLPCALVRDAGRTVVPQGTSTCLGIGPAADAALAPLTGELKLVR